MTRRAGNERLLRESALATEGRRWLQRLLKQTSLTVFFEDYWERKHLFIPVLGRENYGDLLSLRELDAFFSRNDVRYPAVQVIENGRNLPLDRFARQVKIGSYHSDGLIDMDLVAEAYRKGATVLVQLMQNSFVGLAEFSEAIGSFIRGKIDVHAFLTPPNSQGLTAHYDAASAFLIQWRGTKRWRLYELQVEAPGSNQTFGTNRTIKGNVVDEITLQPGDVLYLPRGLPHEGMTVGTESLHLTVVLFPKSWLDILSAILKECQKSEPFRMATSAIVTNSLANPHVAETWNNLVQQFTSRATNGDWQEFVDVPHVISPRSRHGRWTQMR